MKILNFEYNNDLISIEYDRIDEGVNSHFDVYVDPEDNADIEPYTSSNFRVTISHSDNRLSYPVNSPTDYEIKGSLIAALFIQEQIDFMNEKG